MYLWFFFIILFIYFGWENIFPPFEILVEMLESDEKDSYKKRAVSCSAAAGFQWTTWPSLCRRIEKYKSYDHLPSGRRQVQLFQWESFLRNSKNGEKSRHKFPKNVIYHQIMKFHVTAMLGLHGIKSRQHFGWTSQDKRISIFITDAIRNRLIIFLIHYIRCPFLY